MKIFEYSVASIEHPERNEDAVLAMPSETHAPVFVAIDGMGGHQRMGNDGKLITGREAAQLIRTTLAEDLQRLPVDIDASSGGEAEQRATAALTRAHERLMRELNGEELPLNQRVGAVATVVVVCENGQRLLVAQVGDTRGYIFTEGELLQLCPDDDNIEYLVKQGLMSHEDGARITDILNTYDGIREPAVQGTVTIAGNVYDLYMAWRWFITGNAVLNIPPANTVINSIGVHREASKPQTSRMEIAPGDTLLLCSDGIYKNLSDQELIAGLQQPGDVAAWMGEAALARSKDTQNRRSTQDDISALVVRFE